MAAARSYLVAELGGSARRDTQDVVSVAAFEKALTSDLRTTLAVRAQTFLFEQGIDEPVSAPAARSPQGSGAAAAKMTRVGTHAQQTQCAG